MSRPVKTPSLSWQLAAQWMLEHQETEPVYTEPVVTEHQPDGSLEITLHRSGCPSLQFHLHPKQALAFETDATEVLFGGAAGGGKSHMLRVAAIIWCHAIQGLQAYLFRRTWPDLWRNHMEEPTGFPALLAPWLESGYATVNQQGGFIRIGKSKIHLCHLQHEKNIYNYQGAEIHLFEPDELTHFTQKEYRFLRSRVRLGAMKIPEQYKGLFPRILAGTNPGGTGHSWVKSAWLGFAPQMQKKKAERHEGGMVRQFIPSLLEDNSTMAENDPDYESKLEGLGSKAYVEALRYGNWDIVAGAFFDDVWDRTKHVIEPFNIPFSWRMDRSFDWGSSKPFSVCWWAQSDGTAVTLLDGTKKYYPRGTLFLIHEWYGWNGQRNEGLRLTDPEVARGIIEHQRTCQWLQGRDVRPGPADASIFDTHPEEVNGFKQEKSIAREHEHLGVKWNPSQKGPGSRQMGWSKMRQMLKASLAEPMEDPGLFIFEDCLQFIETVPALPRDERNPEDVDSRAEDHIADAVRYRVLEVQFATKAMSRTQPRSAVSYLPKSASGW